MNREERIEAGRELAAPMVRLIEEIGLEAVRARLGKFDASKKAILETSSDFQLSKGGWIK